MVETSESDIHKVCFAIVYTKQGYQMAVGLFGELALIDLETLQKTRTLEKTNHTEIIDLTSSPCGQILIVN